MRKRINIELVFRNRKQGTWKKSKLSVLMVIAIVTILPLAVSDASLNIGTNAKSVTLNASNFDNMAFKPDWVVDDSWTYHITTFDFEVEVDVLTVHIENGEIDDLDVVVDEVQSENYKITFESSDVSGWVSGLVLWWGNLYQTTFSGEVYIRKSDLAIMDLTLHMEGYIKKPIGTKRWFELDMEIDITDGYDSYHFPIVSGESWVVDSAPISVYTSFYLYGIYDADETTYSYIDEHTSTCTEVVTVSVEAGTFEAFHIESDLGTESESYYAPAAFNTVKNFGEDIQDGNQIFTLNDIETELKSLNLQNHPPYPPETPSGPTSGYRDTSYTYSTSAIDPDGDQVRYKFDWGDETQSDWTSWVDSGQSASKSKSWNDLGTYCVKAKSQDENYEESNTWSSCLWVTIQNRAPIANDDTPTVDEDSSNNEIDVLENDYDPDGDDLTITGITPPSHGNASYTADYIYYTPDPDYCDSDSFTYIISDGYGGGDIAYVNITVTCINDPPIANNDFYEVDEDEVLSVPFNEGVLVNDSDIDGPDPLTANLVGDVSYGTLNLNADGSFDYTPNPDYYGTDSFTYQAYDGEDYSNVATVTITVNPVNDPPIANDDYYSVLVNHTLNVAAPGVLENDIDVDNDPLTACLETNVSHGTLIFNADGSFIYTPNENFSGTDSFTYKAYDEQDYSNIATVNITAVTTDPPNAPSIDGPTIGAVWIEYEYTVVTTDPNGDDVYYYVDWGDDTFEDWFGPYESGDEVTVSHAWFEQGTYIIRAKAKDVYGVESNWSEPLTVIISNRPGAPDIDGPVSGNVGTSYDYDFTAIDPDGDDIAEYIVNWGDGTGDETITGPFASGTPATGSHTWTVEGEYVITARAKDVYGLIGPEGTLNINMPRNRAISTPLFLKFLERLLDLFPHAFPILRQLLKLL